VKQELEFALVSGAAHTRKMLHTVLQEFNQISDEMGLKFSYVVH
jgi:hypothetical protein